MADFNLGDRVRMTGTAVKNRRYESPPYGGKFLTEYIEKPVPKVWNKDGGTEYTEGIIFGRRSLQEGHTEYYGEGFDGVSAWMATGPALRVWLVAYDLRYKPVMCFDYQLTRIEETHG